MRKKRKENEATTMKYDLFHLPRDLPPTQACQVKITSQNFQVLKDLIKELNKNGVVNGSVGRALVKHV